jgi:hypothetical protein
MASDVSLDPAGIVIATILRHDSKTTSYKLALIRSINAVAISYPEIGRTGGRVAIPLRILAQKWLAYYWPFVDTTSPILQGRPATTSSGNKQDIVFREALTELRRVWQLYLGGNTKPSDGFIISSELSRPSRASKYAPQIIQQFDRTIALIAKAIEQPIRYAGTGVDSVFEQPKSLDLSDLQKERIELIPSGLPRERSLVINASLWNSFRNLSLWIEALCIHEWCLFTEARSKSSEFVRGVSRGYIYELLTDQPSNRRPLTWERNAIDILMYEGAVFTCPWTEKPLSIGNYDLDHIVPLSVYPTNELWNLVPSDRAHNQHKKRDLLPSTDRLDRSKNYISLVYKNYMKSEPLLTTLNSDVYSRFGNINLFDPSEISITRVVLRFVDLIATARNLARY